MRILPAVIVMCITASSIGCHRNEVHSPIPSGSQPFDQRFLVWMVNHHNDDDRMVNPCATNLTIRQELREFCKTADQQHRERVERMKTWLKEWYGQNFPGTDNLPLWLGGLKDGQFEREFLKQYVHQHADAINPIKECSVKAAHPELRELCQRIAPAQQQQAVQLRRWRCEWFEECE
ncbi:MAG: DUF305 domain-containing protein [Acidobacteria bacterium]|nr:DUF305 domain-containing protein [Acidobacteriota bacterium]